MRYFVSGLPRSRTAWLANFLTFGDSFCFHDGLSGLRSVAELRALMDSRPEGHVGNSDSGLPMFWRPIETAFPGSQLVSVERRPTDALASYLAAFPEADGSVVGLFGRLLSHRDEWIAANGDRALRVDFDDLDKSETLERVWDFCVGGPMDRQRAEMLAGMNVSVLPAAARARVSPKAAAALFAEAML